jgi:hypothetical protein
VTGSAGHPTELKVTFSLEVVALRLTPQWQIQVVRLQPANPIVAVEMKSDKGGGVKVVETGFRLDQIQIAAEGQIGTLRLIPTRQGVQISQGASSFAVGQINVRPANSHRELELVAAQGQSVGVQMIASFELLRVELSAGFEVEALLVRARDREVTIRHSASGEGSRFALEQVALDPEGGLSCLIVRPMA